jgi:hypothetical protein
LAGVSRKQALKYAWEEAIREVLGDEPAMADMQTAGLTDAELLRSYTGHLPDRLGWRQGRVLPNVRENLEALAQRDNVGGAADARRARGTAETVSPSPGATPCSPS